MPKAGKGEVVIKNHAVAVNPVDCTYLHMPGPGSNLTSANGRREDPDVRPIPAKVPQCLRYRCCR